MFQIHCHSFCSVSSSGVKCQAKIYCLNTCKYAVGKTYYVYCLVYFLLSTFLQLRVLYCSRLFLTLCLFYLCHFHHLSLLVSVLNQLPLPSPLPATTTKSLLYNGRIAEEVTCLLGCRDENLASQLAHGLNQVSTEHM